MPEVEDRVLHRPYLRFAFTVVIVAAAFLLRAAIVRYIGAELPAFITFYPAIMVVALLSGLGPGLLATALCVLAADFWLMRPRGSFGIANRADAVALVFFAAMGILVSVVAEAYRRNQTRVGALKASLALHESQEETRRSKEQFETLANAIPQLCWMAKADGHIFWYNQRWYEYTGSTSQQMEGWGWQSVHDPEALPKVLERWKSSIATGEPFDMVFPLKGADGEFRPFLTRVMPVKDADGKVVRWFGTNTDITEQKRIEIELRKSKERLDLAVEVAGLGEWELNPKDHTGTRSLRHNEIFGYSSPVEDWSYEKFLDHVLPELRAEVDQKFRASANAWSLETQIRRADGEVRWIWARGRRRLNEAGETVRMYGVVTDITERKRAEEDSKNSFVALSNFVPQFVWMCTPDGLNIYFNQRWVDYTGLTLEESYGSGWNTPFHPDDKQLAWDAWNRAVQSGGKTPYSVECRLRAADGSYRRFLIRGEPMRDALGEIRRWFGTCTDIEDTKQESESRYRELVQSANSAIIRWSCDGTITFFNEYAQRFFGWSAEEAVGKPVSLLVPERDSAGADLTGLVASIVEHPERFVNNTNENVCRDGRRVWMTWTNRAVRDEQGKVREILALGTDITERKLAEEERARLATIVDSSADAIISKNLDGIVLSWNRSAERLFGYSAEEIIGRSIMIIIPTERQGEETDFLERLRRGESIDHYETVRMDKSGRVIDVSLTLSPIYNAAGVVIAASTSVRDITDRKQAEEALRLRVAALDAAANSIVMTDAAGVIQWVNPAFTKMTGYTAEEAIGQNPRVLKSGKHEDKFYKDMWKQVLSGWTWRGELINRRKDGSTYVEEMTITPVRAADGTITNFLAVKEDITTRKRSERALQESEQRYRTLFETMDEGFCVVEVIFDAEGRPADYRFLQVNPAFIRQTGLRDAEGKRMRELRPEHEAYWFETYGRVAMTGEAAHFMNEARALNRWFDVHAYRVGDPELRRVAIIFNDISDYKRAEAALQASEQRWSTTLQSIGDAVISTDAAGKIDFMNAVAQKLTGWTLAQAMGRELPDVFDIVQEVTRIRPENPVAKVIRLGKIVGLANHTVLIHRDGSEIPIEDSAAPIRDSSGQMEGVVLVFHDVLEQRRVEAALRSSERLATTGRLAATIAHEIHNPLDAVGNLLFLISQETKEASTGEYAGMASGELARVTQMTQQMLGFQREALKPVPVKLGEILTNVLALYDRKLKTADIHLELQIDHDAHIVALPGELRQIFANLVGNAIEAVGPRHGTIALRAYPSHDRRRGVPGVCVVVADNGPGIPPEVRSKIFEPFFTTKGEGGTGLGLWITSDILRKYDGTMRLRSCTRPERSGTCFSIFLPFEVRPDPAGGE